jgi:surfeit locus 1 family protein
VFAPRFVTTVITIGVLAMLISLGRWQLHRADDKRVLYSQFASGTDATLEITAATLHLNRYQHVKATGHYDHTHQLLIDNMSNAAGQAGYYVVTPFGLSGGGWVLVNRGWVPMGASRKSLPPIDVSEEERSLRGRADDLPRPGIQMGQRVALAGAYPIVANFPTLAEVSALYRDFALAPAVEVLLLDADQPDGYLRQWAAPGFPPMRHLAYAVQWFALAFALVVIYGVTNIRRKT